MRRYVQTERPEIKPAKKRVRKSGSAKSSKASTALTAEEIATLPVHLQETYIPPKPKREPAPKKDREPIDPVFINSRAPGSKTLNYRRHKTQPLYTFEDRLNRVTVVDRIDDSFTFRGNDFSVTTWVCAKETAEDVNIHLIDYNAPEPEIDTYHIRKVVLDTTPTSTDYLLDTPAGCVCPKCKTNEYVASDLKNMPASFQARHWRDRESFGSHCQLCKCISKLI